jgi:glutamate dehydrogenase/leucine dehydrogenase
VAAGNDPVPKGYVELEEERDPFLECLVELEEAAHRLELEDWVVHRLKHPEREVTVHLPLARDNGQAVTFTGFRVLHSSVRGPALGVVRFSRHASLSLVKALAVHTTWQCALLDLPLGGSAGAVVCHPEELTERELRELARDYIYGLRGTIGAFTDVVIPDSGSNPQIAAWMFASYTRLAGHMELSVITGKPGVLGGLPSSADAMGKGLKIVLEEVLAERKMSLEGLRVAIQGFGRVGSSVARLLHDAGATIIALADISGGLRNEQGLSIPLLETWVRRHGVLYGYSEAEAVSNAEVLECDCDVLIPAAVERQITVQNAGRIHAPIVMEAARGPTTLAADQVLSSRGVLVVPEMLANGGAILAAFEEWVQGVRFTSLPSEEMEQSLKARLQHAYHFVRTAAHHAGCDLRAAAHEVAIGRVASALRLR